MIEIWKDIPTLEGRYQVSTLGNVRSNARVLSTSTTKGPKIVSIVIDGNIKVFEVRHLIAYTFLGADINSRSKPKLIHIDGDFKNIQLDNLKLADYSDLDNEEWKDIEDFEGVYQVSNKGRIKRLAHVGTYTRKDTGKVCYRNVGEKIIKSSQDDRGYTTVNLHTTSLNKYILVHRLVAKAFIPNPLQKAQVNHIDGDPTNNCADNLEWCTAKENVSDQINRTGRKFLIDSIRSVQGRPVKCIETQQIFMSIGEAAEELGADSGAISSSIKRNTCCFGWTFIFIDQIADDFDEYKYCESARQKYFKWPRAIQKEIDGWTNTYFQAP